MNTVFIVRPFGDKRPVIKKNKAGTPEIFFFDFDKVERDLILPAMLAADLQGGTTQRIFEPGEIKEDMFSGLLLSDIVIADITIHNANVFYELGIRHALRKKTTILIKCDGFDDTPFDIIGYKYLSYDKDNPAALLPDLVKFIKGGREAERKDSPVFNMLPKLKEQETESLLAVPVDFTEEVTLAAAGKRLGKLLLLASEAQSFSWRLPALRLIGEELFALQATDAGRVIWETIKSKHAGDVQANEMLATVYHRLAEAHMEVDRLEGLELLERSNLAIAVLLDNNARTDSTKRAEAFALKGRNLKTKWIHSWKNAPPDQQGIIALQSLSLEAAYKNYERGYYENLNHLYSGINALGLLIIITSLAAQYPEAWAAPFASDQDADQRLNELKVKQQKLTISLEFSITAEKRKLEDQGIADTWTDITEADFICLTSTRSMRVTAIYKRALENAADFYREAAAKQLKIYEMLNILPANIQAALKEMALVDPVVKPKQHFLLFSGHMIDAPTRKNKRFPLSKEATVRQAIKERMIAEKNRLEKDDTLVGIAGGACGGDTLFLELCIELGIAARMYLALPADQFINYSVAFAGNEWVERFNKLYNTLQHPVLSEVKDLPKWLHEKENYDIWRRNNMWMLNAALVNGERNIILLALWDGKAGDGEGGTEHMIAAAKANNARVIQIDMNNL
ncbi:MAG: tetratricopeptide repeat-containing protein [Chitinophagaceae bacterium]